jgi:hypothetical protein
MTDSPIDIAIMLDDAELVRLVASWPKLTEEQRGNADTIASVSNISKSRVESILLRAKTHGLIKDDGTINEYASKYLQALIGERLKKSAKKP